MAILVGQVLWPNTYSTSFANAHHDVTIYEIGGIFENLKNLISLERKISLASKTTFSKLVIF